MHFTDEFVAAVAAAKESRLSSLNHVHLLALVSKADEGLSMTDLSKRVGTSTAGMTGLVDTLEGLGLVERTFPSYERRMTKVVITSKGLETLALMLP